MKILKNLGLSLLSLLLFLSLSLYGLMFMLNQTVLNQKFLMAELDRLDFSVLVNEIISGEQASEEGLPEETRVLVINTITKLEPLIKKQIRTATAPIFDYLLGKSRDLDLALALRNSIDKEFVVSLLDQIDVASLLGSMFQKQLAQNVPEDMPYIAEYLDAAVISMGPWLEEQIGTAVEPILDYLFGQSPTLNVVISLESLKEPLRDSLKKAILKSPPPPLASVPQAEIERLFDEFYSGFSAQMPATFEITEKMFPPEMRAGLLQQIADAEAELVLVRQVISYFQLGYKLLLGFILLLILGIVLIHHQVRGATRGLGVIFLTYGAIEYAGTFIIKYFLTTRLPLAEIPPAVQTWVIQFFNNLLAPLAMFSLGLMIGGIVLVIVSFLYRPHPSAS